MMAQVTVKSLFAEPIYSVPPGMAVGGGDSADNKVGQCILCVSASKIIQVVSSVILDRSVFPYQDIRYTQGMETGTKPKHKKDPKSAPVFVKPRVPMPGGANVLVPIGGDSTVKDSNSVSTPSPHQVSGGAEGSSVGGDSSSVSPGSNNTERSVVKYTPPVTNKGICVYL